MSAPNRELGDLTSEESTGRAFPGDDRPSHRLEPAGETLGRRPAHDIDEDDHGPV